MGMHKVLAIGAHTDDIEFGMGGTIRRLVREGAEVRVVAMSYCGNKALIDEFDESMRTLGVRGSTVYEMPVRHFGVYRQDILQLMVDLAAATPGLDTVFTHNTFDVHQDHQVVANEALRAFKRVNLLGFELPWNSYIFHSGTFMELQEEDLAMKVKAALAYKSQAHRPYANEEYIRALAITRGVSIGKRYAECFQSIRQVP